MSRLIAFFPMAGWLKTYTREDFNSDLLAGIITAILLVPQGTAYAILAGLSPELGLYASILPPALYALLGTSRTLSAGPAAVAAIMIASALNAPEVSALGKPIQFTSVSDIDTTALEALENINYALQGSGKTLNIAEAKGPVIDKLKKTDFIGQLKSGKVFFNNVDAVKELA